MIFRWKGKTMIEDNERNNIEYNHCECCHMKKTFMILVTLILVFMAGIMVGNCGFYHYRDSAYYDYETPSDSVSQRNASRARMHKGMHQVPQPNATNNNPAGGFIVETGQN